MLYEVITIGRNGVGLGPSRDDPAEGAEDRRTDRAVGSSHRHPLGQRIPAAGVVLDDSSPAEGMEVYSVPSPISHPQFGVGRWG